MYSYQEAIAHNPPDKDLALAILKLLMEHGARLQVAILVERGATDKRATPLSFLETQNKDVINLMKYLLSYVYPEDVYLKQPCENQMREQQRNEIVSCVLKRNTLLLAMTPWHPCFHRGSASNPSFLPLMGLVNPHRVEQNFKKSVMENVTRIMDAPQ